MLKIGIIGFGFMGRMHYRHWSQLPDAKVVAICDTSLTARDPGQDNLGNIAGADTMPDLENVEFYQDLDAMLAEQTLDAVSVAIPTYLHETVTCRCLSAGLHVLCEKPMALTVPQAQRMISAAEKAERLLQIGHCIRFWPEYAYLKDIISAGRYGCLLAASFHRISPVPDWSNDSWLADSHRSGGLALDLHIHDSDFIQYAFGMPGSVTTHAATNGSGEPIHLITHYAFDHHQLITAEAGWSVKKSFGFFMGFELMFEQATVTYDCRRTPTLYVYPDNRECFTPALPAGDGYARQIAHFVRAIRGQDVPDIISSHDALQSLRIVAAEIESLRKNTPVNLEHAICS